MNPLEPFPDGALPGRLLFAKVWGSHSHNLAVPESDVDYLAVYAAPPVALLSLDPPPDTVDHDKPDWQAHEAAKFCQLLLKGNPGMVEMLFTERLFTDTPEWCELRASRARFLTKRTVEQYLGYCTGQLKKLVKGSYLHTTGGGFNSKWAYHLMRLLDDAKRIAAGGEPVVWKEGADHDFLMRVRTGEWDAAQIERMATERLAAIDALRPWPLPDEGDRPALNDWLLRLRKTSW